MGIGPPERMDGTDAAAARPRMLRTARWAIGSVAGVVAAASLGSLAYNEATRASVQPARALHPGPYVQIDGRQIAYRTFGERGSPIVLVGGFLEASWVWEQVGSILGRDHRVYALDLPPFGYSQRSGPYTLESWTATTLALAAHFGLDRPLVVGHSLGAAVAVGCALSEPAAVSGIVLLDGDALAEDRGEPRWVSRLAIEPFTTTAYRLATRSDWLFARALAAVSGPEAPASTPSDIEAWQRPFRVAGSQQAFGELATLGIQGLSLPQLRTVQVPATVVWGQDDTVVPSSAGQRSADALGTPMVLIPGAGHLPMITHPAAVAQAIDAAARG